MTIPLSLVSDTYDYFQAVRELRSENCYARAHARQALKDLSLDTPHLALAHACVTQLRIDSQNCGWSQHIAEESK